MDEHGRIEIATGEHLLDMRQVGADGGDAVFISHVIGGDLDRAAVLRECEMVRGLVMVEAHDGVSAVLDARSVTVVVLGDRSRDQSKGGDEKN